MKQIPLAIRHDTTPTFDDFIVGDNALTMAQMQSLRPGSSPPQSVYLWGPSGVGKTHLLGALSAAWSCTGEGAVCSVNPDTLNPEGLRDTMANPLWRLLVLDACDGFTPDQQQTAFALFVEASSRGAVIASAGRLPPIDLILRDDLRTRLGWGLVLPVLPLSEFETRGVLRSEADRRGLVLSDDVTTYLLTRFPRDLKQLMQLLDRLDEFALRQKRALTVPLLKQMLLESPTELP
jgi:DnaA family protein